MEARFRWEHDIALPGVGGSCGAGSATGHSSDRGSFSTAGYPTDNGAESGAASASYGGSLAATLADFLELRSYNRIFRAVHA